MQWHSFEFPWLFLSLPPLLWCLYRCRAKMVPKLFVHLHWFRLRKPMLPWEWLIKAMIIILLVTAIASPILIDRTNPLNRNGLDIVLCLDGSGSMSASGFEDGSRRSRFQIVQEVVTQFIAERDADNVGIVLYGDFAFIASPITYEKAVVSEMISYLNPGMAGQNTAIGDGLMMSLRAFETSKAKDKVVILLTDGEHNSGTISPQQAVAVFKAQGMVIHTIGMGTAQEVNAELLSTIATESGGQAFLAKDATALAEVYDAIDTLERSKIRSKPYEQKHYLFVLPALLGFLLLAYLLWRRP
jgi:Ca-activated chloride channel family protein